MEINNGVQFTLEPDSAFVLLKKLSPKLAQSLDMFLRSGKTETERKTFAGLIGMSAAHISETLNAAKTATTKKLAPQAKRVDKPKTQPLPADATQIVKGSTEEDVAEVKPVMRRRTATKVAGDGGTTDVPSEASVDESPLLQPFKA